MLKKTLNRIQTKYYRYKSISAVDAINEKNFVAYIVNQRQKYHQPKNNFYSYQEHKFPEYAFIQQIHKYDDQSCNITYLDKTNLLSITVPNNFKLKKVRNKAVSQQYEEYTIANLDKVLGHGFTIGSDPEIFVEDDKGVVLPAFNFLGSKEAPNKTHPGGGYGNQSLYWDGFQAEFQVMAGGCLDGRASSVWAGLKTTLELAIVHNKNAKLSPKTTVDIQKDVLENAKDEHVNFGCMPSYNIYGLKGIDAPARLVPFRSAGGHIHFGFSDNQKPNKKTAEPIVKALDAIVGVACVSMFAKFDDPRRRSMYGMAGEYRLPPHGLEYRVLSNAWLYHPLIMHMVYDLARKAVVLGQQGLLKYWNATEKETIETIQNCDVPKAREILLRNKKILLKMFKAAYYNFTEQQVEVAFNAFYNGMESIIKDPTDIAKNWGLKNASLNDTHDMPVRFRTAHPILNKNQKVG